MPTPGVQGEDSWIDVLPLTWGEWRTLGALTGDEALSLVACHLVAWNWVGQDGRALASPNGGAEALDALTLDEVRALIDAVLWVGDEAELAQLQTETKVFFFTKVGTPPPESADLMLCELYHCAPSVLDEQDAARVRRHLAYLNGRAEGQAR